MGYQSSCSGAAGHLDPYPERSTTRYEPAAPNMASASCESASEKWPHPVGVDSRGPTWNRSFEVACSSFGSPRKPLPSARREHDEFEDKIARQVLCLQDKIGWLKEEDLQPLETQLTTVERRQSTLELRLSEVNGFVQALQEEMQTQVRRNDKMESRLQRLRKLVEDMLNSHAGMSLTSNQVERSAFATPIRMQAASPLYSVNQDANKLLLKLRDTVTQQELLTVTDGLRQEMQTMLADSLSNCSTEANLHREASQVSSSLRQDLASITSCTNFKFGSITEKELADATALLSEELRGFTTSSIAGIQQEIKIAKDVQHQNFLEIRERVKRCECTSESLLSGRVDRLQAVTASDVECICRRLITSNESSNKMNNTQPCANISATDSGSNSNLKATMQWLTAEVFAAKRRVDALSVSTRKECVSQACIEDSNYQDGTNSDSWIRRLPGRGAAKAGMDDPGGTDKLTDHGGLVPLGVGITTTGSRQVELVGSNSKTGYADEVEVAVTGPTSEDDLWKEVAAIRLDLADLADLVAASCHSEQQAAQLSRSSQ